ncbi:MAG: sugar phosphate nucleotidyltransferase [Candidatus Kaistia colombiensis]|nr:MAG: sugar phosphate nucleotidyltransferase [Kaistia sp.]
MPQLALPKGRGPKGLTKEELMKAVIQCGGMGTRLRPFTSVLPKPLMPIGARPVLELLLKWLRRNGIQDVYITTGYLGHLIRSFCGNGEQWNLNIHYTQEMEPLGTIGPLSLIRDELTEPFLVLNGDVLTDLSLSRFITAHRKHQGPVTIATTLRTIKMDFGVIDEESDTVQLFREKPTLSHLVSMGLYCMNPDVLQFVPSGVPFGFDDLMLQMLQNGSQVHVYKHTGLWLDIGRIDDFQSAQAIAWDENSASIEASATAA